MAVIGRPMLASSHFDQSDTSLCERVRRFVAQCSIPLRSFVRLARVCNRPVRVLRQVSADRRIYRTLSSIAEVPTGLRWEDEFFDFAEFLDILMAFFRTSVLDVAP
uniref:uncharacterized protein LOC117610455 n=1 Tax=Osmia lignaria TaxID=473952 RepID=UPI001478D675|nr:uncharacterized protein LOC117610455 [Osmia lignaria]